MGTPVRSPAKWQATDWSYFPEAVVATQSGSQVYTISNTGPTLKVTGAGTDGSHRVWYLSRDSDRAADTEILSKWGPHTNVPAGSNVPQVGHVHRVRYDPVTRAYTGIAIWQNIIGAVYTNLLVKACRVDGTTLTQGSAGGSFTGNPTTARNIRVLAAYNIPGFNLRQYYAQPPDLLGMQNGDLITVSSMPATGFNVPVALPAQLVNPVEGSFAVTGTGAGDRDPNAGGTAAFTDVGKAMGVDYWVRSRVEGSRVRVRQWRSGQAEPADWTVDTDFAGETTVPEVLRADGRHGIWMAHVHTGAFGVLSNVEVTRLR